MNAMLEAMKRAGLVNQDRAAIAAAKAKEAKENRERKKRKEEREERKIRHAAWKANAVKNRFGDVAMFEIWAKAGKVPTNYMEICGMCGARSGILKQMEPPKAAMVYHLVCENCT